MVRYVHGVYALHASIELMCLLRVIHVIVRVEMMAEFHLTYTHSHMSLSYSVYN